MDRGQTAKKNFENGYNCAQAVLMAFSDVTGLDSKTSAMVAQSFGAGMGRLREVCGTFSGIIMVLGMVCGSDNPKDFNGKKELYEKVQHLAKEFEKDNGSIVCRELLGLEQKHSSPIPEKRTSEYYKKRPCPELVCYAANLLDNYLKEVNDVK